jgi:soluble lytic murein transglycosylase-like protein
MTTLALALAILRMSGSPLTPGRPEAEARILAATILRAATAHDVPPLILAAIAANESRFDRHRIGTSGERGRWQIMPSTGHLAGYHVSREALANDPINADVAAWWLAHVRDVCARRGVTSPHAWLSKYSGLHRCAPSAYSRAVMRFVEQLPGPGADGPPPALAAYWERIGVLPPAPARRTNGVHALEAAR